MYVDIDLPKTYKNLFYLVGPKKAWIVFPKKGTLQVPSLTLRVVARSSIDLTAQSLLCAGKEQLDARPAAVH